MSIVNINQCDVHNRINPYLLDGYPINFPAHKIPFVWHNDTLNIWSHLIPAIYFLTQEPENQSFVVQLYTLSAGLTLLNSSMWHIFRWESKKLNDIFGLIDHITITITIPVTSALPIRRYIENSDIKEMLCAMLMGLSLLSIINLIIEFEDDCPSKKFKENKDIRKYRYAVMAGMFFLPYFLNYVFGDRSFPLYTPFIVMLTGIAGYLYYSDMPECFYPGKFDYIGHGHQLMHFFVAMYFYTIYSDFQTKQ